MAEISIIVPVYNARRTLGRCVESLLSQTLSDIEVALVDDGSTDGSAEMCDEFSARDKRVRVLHRANAGAGAARNAGARLARGRYIGFADSDDWAEPDMYEKLLARASAAGADIAICDYYKNAHGGRGHMDAAYLAQDFFDARSLAREPGRGSFMLSCVCWNKIFERGFFMRNAKFAERRVAEEVPAVLGALARARRVAAVPGRLYHYSTGSGESRSGDRRAFGAIEAAREVAADMKRHDYGMFERPACRWLVRDMLHHLKLVGPEIREEYRTEVARAARPFSPCLDWKLRFELWLTASGIRRRG